MIWEFDADNQLMLKFDYHFGGSDFFAKVCVVLDRDNISGSIRCIYDFVGLISSMV